MACSAQVDPAKGQFCSCAPPTGPEQVSPGEWEQLAAEAKRRGLPDILTYEQRFVAMADAAEEQFRDGEDLNEMVRAKYLDTAIKSLRAALEIAKYRDDWARIEYRERLAKLGVNGSGKKRAVS